MIKPLIRKRLLVKDLNYKPCAVLVGQTGAGKTTLSNKLCRTEHEARDGRGSVTQNLFRNDVCHGFDSFYLIDTPGTDSKTDTLKHAILLREGLSASAINTVFVVIKYDTRFDRMAEVFMDQPTDLFSKKIVVMITHMDESENPESAFKEICATFDDYCLEVANFIFISKKSASNLIAILMYECMSHMTCEKIVITDEQFHLKFNLFKGFKGEMSRYLKDHQMTVEKIVKEYNDLAADVYRNETEDKDHVLHMAIVSFRKELDALLDDFREKHGGKMQEMENYAFYIQMQRKHVEYNDAFVQKIVPLMSYNLFDKTDPRNLIKACPHCHEVWFKTEGCDGETTCGNHTFGGTFIGIFTSPFTGTCTDDISDYVIKRVNGVLGYSKLPKLPIQKRKETIGVSFFAARNKYIRDLDMAFKTSVEPSAASGSRYRGCGKSIVWKDLPKLRDELILELYKVKTMDEVRKIISAGDWNAARKKYEQGIDMTFKT